MFTYSTKLNVNLGAFSRRIRAVTAKKCTQKLYARAELLFCLFNLFFFLAVFVDVAVLVTYLFACPFDRAPFFLSHYLSLAALPSWKLMFDWNASKNRQYHEISNCLVCQLLIFNKITTYTMEQGRCGGILLCWYFGRLQDCGHRRIPGRRFSVVGDVFLTSIPNPNTKLTLILTLTSTQNMQKLQIYPRLSVVCIFNLVEILITHLT